MPKYTPKPETLARVENVFTFHPSQGDQGPRYDHVRGVAREFAKELLQNCPESPELALALVHLEQTVMYANAAIARNEKPAPPPKP